MRRHPFFVIGSARSGTSLFRLMLTCHPNLVVPPESTFALHIAQNSGSGARPPDVESFVDQVLEHPKMELWELDREALLEHLLQRSAGDLSGLLAGVYEFYGQLQGKTDFIWGDKNNTYLQSIKPLAHLFSHAVFLHIVRDGRDVVCSYRALGNVPGKYAPKLPQAVPDAALNWAHHVQTTRRGFDAIGWDRVYEIRYEDLVANPEDTLGGVCHFLGVEYSSEMLSFHTRNREDSLEPSAFDPWKMTTKQPLTESSVGRWRHEMSDDEASTVEYLARSPLKAYSYELSTRRPDLVTRVQLQHRKFRFNLTEMRRALRKLIRRVSRPT